MANVQSSKSRGEIERELARVLIRFEKEVMGRGPLETKVYILDDLIVVRFLGVLTPAERQLAEGDNGRSQYLLKQVRNELLIRNRPMLETIIRDILGIEVLSVHTDISTRTGERVILFTLHQKPVFRAAEEGPLTA